MFLLRAIVNTTPNSDIKYDIKLSKVWHQIKSVNMISIETVHLHFKILFQIWNVFQTHIGPKCSQFTDYLPNIDQMARNTFSHRTHTHTYTQFPVKQTTNECKMWIAIQSIGNDFHHNFCSMVFCIGNDSFHANIEHFHFAQSYFQIDGTQFSLEILINLMIYWYNAHSHINGNLCSEQSVQIRNNNLFDVSSTRVLRCIPQSKCTDEMFGLRVKTDNEYDWIVHECNKKCLQNIRLWLKMTDFWLIFQRVFSFWFFFFSNQIFHNIQQIISTKYSCGDDDDDDEI